MHKLPRQGISSMRPEAGPAVIAVSCLVVSIRSRSEQAIELLSEDCLGLYAHELLHDLTVLEEKK